jgi:Holliday junction resolvase RusA-like endonuclease
MGGVSILTFSVPGKIIPAVRMTQGSKHTAAAQSYLGYKSVIAAHAKEAMGKVATQTYQPWPIQPVEKTVVDGRRRKKVRLRNIKVLITALTDNDRADADNIAKSVLDALNEIVWKDDRQIGDLHVWVRPLNPGEEEILIVGVTGDE